jgi:hypothetical protein
MVAQVGYSAAHGDLDVGAVAAHGLHHLPALHGAHDVGGHANKV